MNNQWKKNNKKRKQKKQVRKEKNSRKKTNKKDKKFIFEKKLRNVNNGCAPFSFFCISIN